MENLYEHHISIESNKLTPFKYHEDTAYMNLVVNWHKNIEILFIEKGEGFVKYGSEDFAVSKNDIIIINSGTMHRLYSKTGVGFRCLIISDKFFKENGIDINKYRFKEFVRDDVTQSGFLKIAHAIKEKNSGILATAVIRKSVLDLIIDICTRHVTSENTQTDAKNSSEEYVKKAVSYINDNFTQNLSLQEISDFVGVSKYHMAREFKKYTGQTPFTYINIMRCKKADVCISEGMSITETAMECGFETVSYFSRTYKKLMGINPSKAKKKG